MSLASPARSRQNVDKTDREFWETLEARLSAANILGKKRDWMFESHPGPVSMNRSVDLLPLYRIGVVRPDVQPDRIGQRKLDESVAVHPWLHLSPLSFVTCRHTISGFTG